MIAMLPYPNFACSAMVLDRMRLGRQIPESRQLLLAIRNGGGWRNHPSVLAWRGSEAALRLYHDVMLREWLRRGYVSDDQEILPPLSSVVMPAWLGRGEIHASHRGLLLLRDRAHYGQFGWDDAPTNELVWD